MSPILLHEFDNYLNLDEPLDEADDLNNEELKIMSSVKKQEELFMQYSISRQSISKYDKNGYTYLTTKENNLHGRIMKEKDIELSRINKERDIELSKINREKDIELSKIKRQNMDNEIKLLNKQIKLTKLQTELELIKSERSDTNNKKIPSRTKTQIIKL